MKRLFQVTGLFVAVLLLVSGAYAEDEKSIKEARITFAVY